MPELPEVETVRRGLAPHMEGRRVLFVEQRRPDLRFPFPADFVARLEGNTVIRVGRRAKYLLIDLADGWTWLVHLGMSGRFTVNPGHDGVQASSGQVGHNSGWALADKHDHVRVEMEAGAKLVFNDVRRFGFMDLIPPGAAETSPHLAGLGPEPLGADFTPDHLRAVFKDRKTPVKAALLDQQNVAGLGNIYVCEALWRAGISPRRLAKSVQGQRAEKLVTAVRDVIAQAIEAGGSSLRDFVQADGELGYFQHSWDAYGREGEPCKLAGCDGIIRRIVQSGRSTFYCPKHQR